MLCNNSIVQICVNSRICSLASHLVKLWPGRHSFTTLCNHSWAERAMRHQCREVINVCAHCDDCVHSNQLHWIAGDLFTTLLFLLFNLGDLVGRLLSGIGAYVNKSPPASMLMGYALSRIVLAAALVFCHVVTPHTWRAPEVFR